MWSRGRAAAALRCAASRANDAMCPTFSTPRRRYAAPRGALVQPIQDIVRLHDIEVSVAVQRDVKSVQLVPSGKGLDFTQRAGRAEFTGHG